jgi:hypothetical protein
MDRDVLHQIDRLPLQEVGDPLKVPLDLHQCHGQSLNG